MILPFDQPFAIIGTAARAASSPTSLQRVKCSFRTKRASNTVTAGYSDVITTASSSLPCWLAKTNIALADTSKNPAIAPSMAGVRSSLRGARVTATAMAVDVKDPTREIAATQVGDPLA